MKYLNEYQIKWLPINITKVKVLISVQGLIRKILLNQISTVWNMKLVCVKMLYDTISNMINIKIISTNHFKQMLYESNDNNYMYGCAGQDLVCIKMTNLQFKNEFYPLKIFCYWT